MWPHKCAAAETTFLKHLQEYRSKTAETVAKTTKQIANEANCDERYVEEWCQVKQIFLAHLVKIWKI